LREQGFSSPLKQYELSKDSSSEDSVALKAKHKLTGAKTFLKVIYKDMDLDDLSILPEVALHERLQGHQNVAKYIESFEKGNFIYIAFAYIARGDLQSYMINHRVMFLTEHELKDGARQIGQALSDIHNAGCLHNDVHPRHILLKRHQTKPQIASSSSTPQNKEESISVKLGGFSHCTPVPDETDMFNSELIDPENQDAKALYKAPEVISRGLLSKESDVWALGISLFWLTCGHLPFATLRETAESPVPWHFYERSHHHVSTNFKNLINQMLAKDKDQRPSI